MNTSHADRVSTFGRIQIPTLFLWSGADGYVPPDVKGSDIVDAFNAALPPESRTQFSGVVPEAAHVSLMTPAGNVASRGTNLDLWLG